MEPYQAPHVQFHHDELERAALTSLRTVIELISATSTTTGLTIQAAHYPSWYPTGVKISDAELAAVPLTPHEWHGDWNYTISAHSVVA